MSSPETSVACSYVVINTLVTGDEISHQLPGKPDVHAQSLPDRSSQFDALILEQEPRKAGFRK
jgi:hypothetical protein